MTVPTPTADYTNFSLFTAENGAEIVDGRHGPLDTAILDGVNDYLSSSQKPFATGSGVTQTTGWWFKAGTMTASDGMVAMWESGIPGTETFLTFMSGTELSCFFSSSSGSASNSKIASGMRNWDDGSWHYIAPRANGNDVDIFIDGLEATAYTLQNSVSGGGFTGFGASNPTLAVGQWSNVPAGRYMNADFSRLKFWNGTRLSDAEMLELYNNEVASILSGSKSNPLYPDGTLLASGSLYPNSAMMPNDSLMKPQ